MCFVKYYSVGIFRALPEVAYYFSNQLYYTIIVLCSIEALCSFT